jgi:hypothetical protein
MEVSNISKAICSIEGCETEVGPSGAHGWCQKHYRRWTTHGDPLWTRSNGFKQPCSVAGCDREVGSHGAKGMCSRHYSALKNHGDPLAYLGRGYRGTIEDLFWAKVDKNGPIPVAPYRPVVGPCWIWTAALDTRGYGKFGTTVDHVPHLRMAHRVAWELVNGPFPEGLEPDHLCLNHGCVNPSHLEPVTHSENVRRGWETSRQHQWAKDRPRRLRLIPVVVDMTVAGVGSGLQWPYGYDTDLSPEQLGWHCGT